ncbi:MAG: hypothetical protein JNL98_30485 [Bryobacterales bacterium]|nr:hypothetical protein [Bryobacterales bacterium]
MGDCHEGQAAGWSESWLLRAARTTPFDRLSMQARELLTGEVKELEV